MHYLSESGFVHRDLAARNVLVNKDFICKVCDFGLSQVADGGSEAAKDDKIPIRWTAPEAVLHHQFSVLSDVWSYGVLLWEMWSYGAMPYKGWANDKVMTEVLAGYRMPNPKNCPTFIHLLMMECWNEDREERPSFFDIFEKLIAAYTFCKPSNYATGYTYDESGKRVKKAVLNLETSDEYADPDAYDLGGLGGKIKRVNPVYDDDDDPDAYDLGGEGGKIAKPPIAAFSSTDEDDEDPDAYDLGGAIGGKIVVSKPSEVVLPAGMQDEEEEAFGNEADEEVPSVLAHVPETKWGSEENLMLAHDHRDAADGQLAPDERDFDDPTLKPDASADGYLEQSIEPLDEPESDSGHAPAMAHHELTGFDEDEEVEQPTGYLEIDAL
jgi:serine/threonine protein kinase